MDVDTDEIARALEALGESGDSIVTSVRVPERLRHASMVLQKAGLITSWNELLVQGAIDRIEAVAQRAGLDAHYAEFPHVRPTIFDIALALARMDDSELVGEPELIKQAARELSAERPNVAADDVLTYALALRAHRAAA